MDSEYVADSPLCIAFCIREIKFVTSRLLSCTPISLKKEVYSTREEFAPFGANSFLVE